MEEVGQSTPEDSNETDLLEASQIFIRQLKESKNREVKLQEKIRILEKEREIQNGTTVPNQQQHHGVQELRQQIAELTQQFRQLKSISDEKVQRLSNEVARLETETKDKDAKIKDMADRENAHSIDGVRTERDELHQQLNEANAQMKKANKENERLKRELDENEYRLADTRMSLSKAEERVRESGTEDAKRKLEEYEKSRVELRHRQREIDDLRAANEEALKQVDDLRKTNEDMNANIAQTINEKESAVERILELAAELRTTKFEKNGLQTRMHDLEDENQRLKEANELFESEREAVAANIAQLQREKSSCETQITGLERIVSRVKETAASSIAQLQREKELNEARITELEHIVSRVREDARREQRKLQDEIVALKEHGKKIEGLLSANNDQWESARKKAEDLEAERPRLRNEGRQEIKQVKDNFQRTHKVNRIRRSASQDTLEEPMCSMCGRSPVNAQILPCKHAVGCYKCMDDAIKEKKKCPQCHVEILAWMFFIP